LVAYARYYSWHLSGCRIQMNSEGTHSGNEEGLFAVGIKKALIVLASGASGPELRAAEMLCWRIDRRSSVEAKIVVEETPDASAEPGGGTLIFLVGKLDSHELLSSMADRLGLKLPTLPDTERIHPEGFAIRTGEADGSRYVLLAGCDDRGTIYGVGALLRSMIYRDGSFDVPRLDLVDQPAFPLRGTGALSVGPNPVAVELADLRNQTEEERDREIEEMILSGANTFRSMEEMAREYGLMTSRGFSANSFPGEIPKEWSATPSNSLHIKVYNYFGGRFACPSIPEARKAILKGIEERFREGPGWEYVTIKSGDVAGCTCERCMPWGGTFIRLVHEIADILHKYHPDSKLLATSQNLTVEGDQAILDYLNEHNTGWLYAFQYAPGGNQMTTYNRPPLNPVWFEYRGFGRWANYLKHLHHQLPSKTTLALVTDVSHWIRSQYGVDKPDVALAVVYNRRAFNARPRAYDEIAGHVLHYAVGDIAYSEGMHDDFNKWFWFRKLWNPQRTAEDITRDYCRYWFGPDAEGEMAEAIYTMEDNLENRVLGNPGIPRAVELLESARREIPPNLMRLDHRWRMIYQKALLDRYIQLRLERGEELKERATTHLAAAAKGEDVEENFRKALAILSEPERTEEMASIKDRIREIGDESHDIIGYREPAYYNVDDFDITEVRWWRREVNGALNQGGKPAMRNAAAMITRYEDPGEGGYYERTGWPYDRVHLIENENILGYFPFTGPARAHQYAMAYSWRKQDSRMILVYDDIDPECQYVVRLCTGFHCDPLEEVVTCDLFQSLEANGVVIEEMVPIPLGGHLLSEYEIPREVTGDGRLEIVLRSQTEEFPFAGLSGIWLMRKDKMPWKS